MVGEIAQKKIEMKKKRERDGQRQSLTQIRAGKHVGRYKARKKKRKGNKRQNKNERENRTLARSEIKMRKSSSSSLPPMPYFSGSTLEACVFCQVEGSVVINSFRSKSLVRVLVFLDIHIVPRSEQISYTLIQIFYQQHPPTPVLESSSVFVPLILLKSGMCEQPNQQMYSQIRSIPNT